MRSLKPTIRNSESANGTTIYSDRSFHSGSHFNICTDAFWSHRTDVVMPTRWIPYVVARWLIKLVVSAYYSHCEFRNWCWRSVTDLAIQISLEVNHSKSKMLSVGNWGGCLVLRRQQIRIEPRALVKQSFRAQLLLTKIKFYQLRSHQHRHKVTSYDVYQESQHWITTSIAGEFHRQEEQEDESRGASYPRRCPWHGARRWRLLNGRRSLLRGLNLGNNECLPSMSWKCDPHDSRPLTGGLSVHRGAPFGAMHLLHSLDSKSLRTAILCPMTRHTLSPRHSDNKDINAARSSEPLFCVEIRDYFRNN